MELLKLVTAVPLESVTKILLVEVLIGEAFKVDGGIIDGLATVMETLELPVPKALGGMFTEMSDWEITPPVVGVTLFISGAL